MYVYADGEHIDVKQLELLDIIEAETGEKLIIKELPYYPPVFCTQDGCDEFAEYHVILVEKSAPEDPTTCSLCGEHMDRLIDLNEIGIPIRVVH